MPELGIPYAGIPYAGIPYAGIPYAGIPYRLKRFPGTKPYNKYIWFHLKRFLGTKPLNIRRVVSKSCPFTHDMTFLLHDVRGKRFNAHGKLHCMEMTISKDHVAGKPRRGWSLGRHGRP